MKNRYLSVILIIFVLPLLLIINATPFYSHIRNIVSTISKPVFESSHFLFFNLTEGAQRLINYAEIVRMNEQLRSEVFRLQGIQINIAELKAENSRLRDLLNFKQSLKQEHISTQIIGRDVSLWSNWIILNFGYRDGATKDMPIIAPGGLVGKIVSVGNFTARAILIIDHRSKVSALIQQSREMGIIAGTGNGLLKMSYLNLDSIAKVGDTVITSGFGGIYPKEIPIGTVSIIGKEKNGLHLFAKIKPFVDFSKLEEVLCLKK